MRRYPLKCMATTLSILFRYLMVLSLAAPFAKAADHNLPNHGNKKPPTNKSEPRYWRDLETRIWTSDEFQLPTLERLLVREIQLHPKEPFFHYLMSHLSIRMLASRPSDSRLMHQASTLAEQAIALDPKSEYGYIAMAELLDLMGHAKKGVSLLSEAINTGIERSWRMRFSLARFSIDSMTTEESLTHLSQSLESDGAIRKIIAPYVASIIQTKYGSNSLEALQRWNKKFPNPIFSHLLAVKISEKGNFIAAHEIYKKILKADPKNTEAIINDSILLYRHLGNSKGAVTQFHRLEMLNQDRISLAIKPVFYGHMASAELNLSQMDNARRHFLEALRSSSNTASMIDFISASYKQKNKVNDLVEFLSLANLEIPGKAILHAYLGEIYAESLTDHATSLTYFANAIALNPNRSEYYNAMGLSYYHMDELAAAQKLFSAAIKINPSDSTAQYNLACVFAKTGAHKQAIASLTTAFQLDPLLQKTATKDSDFDSMRTMPSFMSLILGLHATKMAH